MDPSISQLVVFAWKAISDFASQHLETFVAAFVLFLAYRLLRLGMQRAQPMTGDTASRTYLLHLAPGIAFGVGGIVLALGREAFLSRHFETIVAAFVLFLGFVLIRKGLDLPAPAAASEGASSYLRHLAPGAAFALVGIVFVMGRDPSSLMIYLLTLTVAIGFGFAALGYRLFLKGVLGDSDLEAVWSDRKLLLRRAAPGTLFALFGLTMIGLSLWQGPGILKDYNTTDRQIREREILADERQWQIIDQRTKEGLEVLRQYLASQSERPNPALEPTASPGANVDRGSAPNR